jgi:hypothetical protein
MMLRLDPSQLVEPLARYVELTEEIHHAGYGYRILTLRGTLLERAGHHDEAQAGFERARHEVQTLLERLPPEHQPMFEAHPWVRDLYRYRLV